MSGNPQPPQQNAQGEPAPRWPKKEKISFHRALGAIRSSIPATPSVRDIQDLLDCVNKLVLLTSEVTGFTIDPEVGVKATLSEAALAKQAKKLHAKRVLGRLCQLTSCHSVAKLRKKFAISGEIFHTPVQLQDKEMNTWTLEDVQSFLEEKEESNPQAPAAAQE